MATGIQLNNIQNKYKFYPRTILDIGAQIGDFAQECKTLWPNTKISMIEATHECEPHLQGLAQHKDYEYRIEVLSDISGKEVNFYKTKHAKTNTGNSIYRENTQYYDDQNVIVEQRITTTLDELYKDGQFDMIKIDTQGSEIDIMKGGSNLISKAVMIILEVSYINYNEGAPLADSVDKFMTNNGFVKDIKVGESKNDTHGIFQEDFVYVNKEFIK